MAYMFLFYLTGVQGSLISTCEILRDLTKGSMSAVCFQAGSPHSQYCQMIPSLEDLICHP